MPGSSAAFCASVPAFRIAPAASTAEAKYGAHSSTRPISSSTMHCSENPKPCPPYASGIRTAASPISAFICAHEARSHPASVSISRRTSLVGDRSAR